MEVHHSDRACTRNAGTAEQGSDRGSFEEFYPPSLAWFHFVDTQLLLKCQSESFLITCERYVSGSRYVTTGYRRNAHPTALLQNVYVIAPLNYYSLAQIVTSE